MLDDFSARGPDELSLVRGELIELIEKDDDFGDGWYLGKHLQDGRTGLFPEGKDNFYRYDKYSDIASLHEACTACHNSFNTYGRKRRCSSTKLISRNHQVEYIYSNEPRQYYNDTNSGRRFTQCL